MLDPIALAVPFFFVLIGIELVWAKRRGVSVYRFSDALTNLSCGIGSQIAVLFWGALQLAVYAWLYERYRVATFQRAWVPWVIAFVGVDLLYYWWHRLSHQVNVLWAAHVVHHQSEDYNLAVALRQSVITSWTVLPFYLPLALLGVPPLTYAITVALSTLYQFWIHTQLVGKVKGPIEWVLNLPSHHRVHHAINDEYLDKNYGATLVVWDRLFGTYAPEEAAPVYGITKPLGSFDPVWAQVHYWVELRAMARAARSFREKLAVWVASPAWKPAGYVVETPPVQGRAKHDRPLTRRLVTYVAVQYVLVIAATFALMMWHAALPAAVLVPSAVAVAGALVAAGALLEGRRWAVPAELGRLALAAVAVAMLVSTGGCRRDKRPVTVTTIEGPSAVLPAPLSAPGGETRVSRRRLAVDGVSRDYLLVEPAAPPAAGTKLPVVFVLHGDGGTMESFHEGFPFEKASGDGAYLVYPDGIHATWDLDTKLRNREVAFFEHIATDLAARYPIDRARVFAAGYSSGGFLANLVACQKPGFFRAITSSAGGAPYRQALVWANGFTKCPGQEPTAALALHGTGDHNVTLDSGRFSATYWAYVNGCTQDAMETTAYDECHAYRGCPAGKAVAWCEVPGLGHWVWDHAAEASWTFFRTQSR
ncbi:MAG: Sterol desaturase [Labilithrix sp.]|nr:Sterol desaturase [Labilithrix sp.]